MRIISKTHDYFDVIQKYGFDDDIIYLRDEREIITNNKHYNDIYVQKYVIGFAGKLYPLIYYTGGYNKYEIPNDIKCIAYNIEELDECVNTLFNNKEKEYYFDKFKKYYSFNSYRRSSYLEFFTGPRENILCGRDIFCEFNVPIFLARIERLYDYNLKSSIYKIIELTINCTLGPWEFYRIKDAYTAFFELRDYIGGVLLGNNRSIPVVSNEDLIVAKGFDLKTSFRKEAKQKK